MSMVKRFLAGWMALMLICLAMPFAASAEASGWRILDSQQNGDSLEVWFVTDEQIGAGQAVYNYGGIPLAETGFSTMEGVGYIFVVDNNYYYGSGKEKDPKVIIRGAADRMSDWDSVAFFGVTQEQMQYNPKFVAKGSWEEQYNEIFGSGKRSGTEYTWEAISKAISFARDAYQSKAVREMVLILITDGVTRGKSKDAESCRNEIRALPMKLPFYCLRISSDSDEKRLVDFVNGLEEAKFLKVINQNASTVAEECVLPYSNLIYKSTLQLGADVHEAVNDTLSISLAGSQKGVTQNGVLLKMSEIPTPTPEPNAQFVGSDSGTEHEIWELQRALIQLGFMTEGEPSGVWDGATANALNLYYAMNEIGTDRIPERGGITKEAYAALLAGVQDGSIVTPTPAPTDTPTPAPTATPTVDPDRGQYIGYDTADRSMIRALNKALKEKYYLDADVDGSTYSDATETAVNAFYADHPELTKPDVGEGISRAAYDALMTAVPKDTPVPTAAPTEDPSPAYINFDTSNANLIAELNQHLVEKFFVQNPDAIVVDTYNEATNEAVKRFYQYYEDRVASGEITKPSTGVGITRDAFEYLIGSAPIPTATPIPDLRMVYDEEGMQAADALKAEKRLEELGYLTAGQEPTAESLRKAVLWFAERNGLAAAEEYLDEQTFQRLMSEDARPAEDPPEEILPGAKEPAEQIRKFQDALKKNGYFRDVQESMHPGTFDEATQAAYRRYCEVNGITWDGKGVTWESQQNVLASNKENPALSLFENTKLFVTGNYELFGLKVPVWALLAVLLLIIVAVILVVIFLVKGRKRSAVENDLYTPVSGGGEIPQAGADAPTEALDEGFSAGADAPTDDFGASGGCELILTITDPTGTQQETTYIMPEGAQKIIGRGSDSDIITESTDTTASRHHGILRFSDGKMYYEDTSRHHTTVDGEVLDNATRELQQGSELQIGKTIIKVQWS